MICHTFTIHLGVVERVDEWHCFYHFEINYHQQFIGFTQLLQKSRNEERDHVMVTGDQLNGLHNE